MLRRYSACLLAAALQISCGEAEDRSQPTGSHLPATSPARPAVVEPHRPAPIRPPGNADLPPFSELLSEAIEAPDPMRSLTLGRQRVALVRDRLDRAGKARERFQLTVALGREQLWAGQTEEAIKTFRGALEMPAATEHAEERRQVRKWVAIAYLRLGEEENCLALHRAGSCILPIAEDARHVEQRGSKAAMAELIALLAEKPTPGLRWLLNLAAMTLGEYPDGVPAEHRLPRRLLAGETSELPRFVDRAAEFGLSAAGLSGGVVTEDFDGDGRLDVMVSSWGLHDPLRLFRNQGNGTFAEAGTAAGLGDELGGLNLIHADDNNDGHPDVLVLRGAWLGAAGLHPNSLLRNHGDGTFSNVTLEAGLLGYAPTQTAAWADYDGDGWLDLLIGNEAGSGAYTPCQLYRNHGDGTYSDVAPQLGLDISAFVKGVAWGDYDDDGWPDLYLSIFGQPNRLLRNQGPAAGFRFADVTRAAGVAQPLKSFATWFWDYDNDGLLDLLAASYSGLSAESLDEVVRDLLGEETAGERPRLYRNRGDGTFEDHTAAAGLDTVLLAMGANYGDLDNDGFLDVYFGTGEPSFSTLVPNRMFHNRAGRTFDDVSLAAGFGHLQKGHAIAFADLDNDGDQDVYAVIGGAYAGDVYPDAVFVNPGSSNRWLTLRLEGRRANRSAIGARVEVRVVAPGGERSIFRTVSTGGSFGSSSLQLEIGLGSAAELLEVNIRWPLPGLGRQRFTDLESNTIYRLIEGEQEAIRELP